jgi:TolA-binding protein
VSTPSPLCTLTPAPILAPSPSVSLLALFPHTHHTPHTHARTHRLAAEIRELNELLLVSKHIEQESIRSVEMLEDELATVYGEVETMEKAADDLKYEWNKKWTKLTRSYRRLEDELTEVKAGRSVNEVVAPSPAVDDAEKVARAAATATADTTAAPTAGIKSLKERANALEASVKTAEADVLREHINLLGLFLPPSYHTSEKHGVELVLFLRCVVVFLHTSTVASAATCLLLRHCLVLFLRPPATTNTTNCAHP